MSKKLVTGMGLVFLMASAAPALAQRAEVGITFGYTFADGVELTDSITPPAGGVYNRVDPKDGGSFGIDIGVFVGPNAEVGFLYGKQWSTLQASGTNTVDIGDLSINSYHGYFAYNWGEADAKARPYAYGGLGATSYSDVDFQTINRSGTISGLSRFSTTWGAGVKFYPSPHVGARVGFNFTPTYIKSDAAGWWCDPFWGCYVVGDAQYANQFGFNGGVTFRF